MDWAVLPPEINSLKMYTGPGAAPMMGAAASWSQIAAGLAGAATAITSMVTGLVAAWMGPSSLAMSRTMMSYARWLMLSASLAEQTAAQATAAAAAFETAFTATVPPPVIDNNRLLCYQLMATNILGQNTPAIMLLEAQYMEMWSQDVAAMAEYQLASAQASMLPVFSGLDIFAPGSNQETAGLAGMLNLFSGSTGSAFGSFINANLFTSGWAYAVPMQGLQSLIQFVGLGSLAQGQQQLEIAQANEQPSVNMYNTYPLPQYSGVSGGGVSNSLRPAAAVGWASKVGALSTPGSWRQTVNEGAVTAEPEGAGTPGMVAPMGGVMPNGVGGKGDSRLRPYGFPVKILKQHPLGG